MMSSGTRLLLAWIFLQLWASQGHAMNPTPSPPRREMIFNHAMGEHDVVYFLATPRLVHGPLIHFPTTTHAQVQRIGGIQDLDDNSLPNFILTSTDLHEMHAEGSGHPGSWIYQISTGPHMVQIENWQPDQDAEPRHYMTVGAVMWSQIMAFAVTNGTDTVDDLVWQSNPEYNRTWEQFGGSPWQPMVGPVGPGAREQMRRFHQLARDDTDPYGEFLDELTIYPNPALDEGHRYIIRALFDWDRRMEPERGFPLARLNRRTYTHLLPGKATYQTAQLESPQLNMYRAP